MRHTLQNPCSSVSIGGFPSRFFVSISIFLAVTAAGLVLFFFNPAHHSFYPTCPLHQWTGLSCPGCGGLRALHQLSHGHFAAAFQLNALLIVLLPVVGWLALREIILQTSGKNLPSIFLRPVWGWSLLALAIIFTVIRNLPWLEFSWMAAP